MNVTDVVFGDTVGVFVFVAFTINVGARGTKNDPLLLTGSLEDGKNVWVAVGGTIIFRAESI